MKSGKDESMASEATLKKQIEQTVGDDHSNWAIGVTDDPAGRKAQLGNPLSWLQWKADSEQVARNIKHFFLQKGMKRADGVPSTGHFVYIV
ncbi:MAG: hypothetical protein ACE5JB_06575 [bacterium]